MGGETNFHRGYDGNILVNAMCVGLAKADAIKDIEHKCDQRTRAIVDAVSLEPREGDWQWAGPDRLIWEGWFDTSRVSPIADEPYASVLVFRDPDNIQLELFAPAATRDGAS